MTNQKSQVDYVLINRKYSNSMKDVSAYNYFVSIGSDHRILRAKLKLSFRMKKIQGQMRYDWRILRQNKDMQKELSQFPYKIDYAALCGVNNEINRRYSTLCLLHSS